MSGGRRFDLGPLGTVVAPNITSDPVAGIGAMSDAMLVRSLRYGVSRSGRPLIPIMPFAELTDRDLQAIISYLRTLQPVSAVAPANDFSWIGSFAISSFLEPQGPTQPPPSDLPPERSAEYGRFLAHTVANCHGCHTRRSKLTGDFIGPPFGGGMKITEGQGAFVAPNLTPVPDGVLQLLTEREFIERFRLRAQANAPSPMPWTAFARMTDDDLGAIYRYLKTLPASPASR
jgi:mono/diheme cytochrome c family protein